MRTRLSAFLNVGVTFDAFVLLGRTPVSRDWLHMRHLNINTMSRFLDFVCCVRVTFHPRKKERTKPTSDVSLSCHPEQSSLDDELICHVSRPPRCYASQQIRWKMRCDCQ